MGRATSPISFMACSNCKKKAQKVQVATRNFKRDINEFIEKLKKERGIPNGKKENNRTSN